MQKFEQFSQVGEDIFYTPEKHICVDEATIEFLKTESNRSLRKQSRLCTHVNENDPLHEMLIVHTRNMYVRPHRHLAKSESFHVIEGEVDIITFDDSGAIQSVTELGQADSGKIFYSRFNLEIYHTLIMRSDIVVFHETTLGPFSPELTQYADWAPAIKDNDAVIRFQQNLQTRVNQYKQNHD